MAVSTGRTSWGARTLFDWGGNLGELSLHGEPWRLLSGTFLHASPGHILGNMVLLAITGSYLQRRLGPAPFLAAYLACGVLASLLSAYAHPDVVGIGASGAIAGLLGLMVALYLAGRAQDVSGSWIVQTVGINALYSFAPNVDWTAHLGGFVAGLLIGGAVSRRLA